MTVELGPTRVRQPGLWGFGEIDGYPLSASVSSPFGPREPIWTPVGWTTGFHSGIDLPAPHGTPIQAPAPCEVRGSYRDDAGGQTVAVRYEDGSGGMFIHMEGLQLGIGQQLRRGDFLGFVGTSGLSTGDHLHYMRMTRCLDGPTWYSNAELIDPLSPEGGFVEALSVAPAEPPRDVVTGPWPAPGQASLIVAIADCSPEEVLAEASYEGCAVASLWSLEGGIWRGYTPGAPAAVNAAFPNPLPASRALYVRAGA